jgi:hypothetical protein
MPKGIALTKQQKKQVAFDYIAGKELSAVAAELGVSPVSLYRMRASDKDYQRFEGEAEEAAVNALRVQIKRSVNHAIATLVELSQLDTSSESVKEVFHRTNEQGYRVKVERRVVKHDARLVSIRLEASAKLLDAYLRTLDSESANEVIDEWIQRREQLLQAAGISSPAAPPRPPLPLTATTIEPEPDDTDITDLLRKLGEGAEG